LLEHFASAQSAHDLMTYTTIYGSELPKADAMFAASAT
jgi:hypothetical protein